MIKNLFKNTKHHREYWKLRKIDWKQAYMSTHDHPHRAMIIEALRRIEWKSLFEVGMGCGANLVPIVQNFQGRQVGGIDISEDAVKLAQESFKGGYFKVGTMEDMMLSDKAVDVILSDMALIYIDPSKIDGVMKEIKRVARNNVIFCELASETLYGKIRLRLRSGYHAHNYTKLLEKHGFRNITKIKIPPELWEGGEPQKTYGYVIMAKVPRR